jgi:hypothetical protein
MTFTIDISGNKDAIEAQARGEVDGNTARPKAMAIAPLDTPMAQMNLDNTVFAFTKIMWLNMPTDVMQVKKIISLNTLLSTRR